jgi:hypothetical protein
LAAGAPDLGGLGSLFMPQYLKRRQVNTGRNDLRFISSCCYHRQEIAGLGPLQKNGGAHTRKSREAVKITRQDGKSTRLKFS